MKKKSIKYVSTSEWNRGPFMLISYQLLKSLFTDLPMVLWIRTLLTELKEKFISDIYKGSSPL